MSHMHTHTHTHAYRAYAMQCDRFITPVARLIGINARATLHFDNVPSIDCKAKGSEICNDRQANTLQLQKHLRINQQTAAFLSRNQIEFT